MLTSIVLVFIVLLVVLIGWLIGCLFLLFLLRRLSRCIVLGWLTCSYLAAVYSLFLFVCCNSKWRQSGGGCCNDVIHLANSINIIQHTIRCIIKGHNSPSGILGLEQHVNTYAIEIGGDWKGAS